GPPTSLLLLLLLPLAALPACTRGALGSHDRHTGTPPMNTAQATAIELITLPDEQYYTIDDAGLMDLQTRLVAALNGGDLPPPPGAVPADANFLALSAPRTVVPERRDDLPFLLAFRQTG